MLSASYLASCSDEITKIYAQLEHDISVSLVKHLANMGEVSDLITWQMKIAKETGTLQQDISKYLDKYNSEAQTKIKQLYQEAMTKNKATDTHFVKEANRELSDTQETVLKTSFARFLNASKINKNYNQMQTKYSADAIFNSIKRQTLTIADTSEQSFIKQANAAYMKVATGAFDSQTAIKDAITNLAKEDIQTVSYSQSPAAKASNKPITRSIEAAVRSNVMTGINQSASQQTLQNLDELGSDLVEVDAHLGARNRDVDGRPWANHSEWQGKIYSLSGKRTYRDGEGNEQVAEDFYAVCGLGEPDGICGVNCRHSFYPYFEGMEAEYSKGELSEMKDPQVEYNGKMVSQYEAEQTLRGFERNIRKYKKQADALAAGGLDNTQAKDMLKQYQSYARDLCKQTGINRDYAREFVGKITNPESSFKTNKSVGAMAKRFYVQEGDSVKENESYKWHIKDNTYVTGVKSIAHGDQIKDIKRLLETYKLQNGSLTNVSDWDKVRGTAYLYDGSETKKAEIHWYQCKNIGKLEFKVKRWIQEK